MGLQIILKFIFKNYVYCLCYHSSPVFAPFPPPTQHLVLSAEKHSTFRAR